MGAVRPRGRWGSLARRFASLRPSERRLVVRAALLMGAIRVALSFLPVRAVRRALVRGRRARASSGAAPGGLARAVIRAGTVVPGATCLVQALALTAMLERRGHAAQLVVGFGRTPLGSLDGHAWVETEGAVIGGSRFDAPPAAKSPWP